MDWLVPKHSHEVHSFMGLVGYYHMFVERFSRIVKPITTLQQQGARYERAYEFGT